MRLEDLKGRRLGRYEIVALLGRGGMAAVYRAHDTGLRRDVALKVLYPQYTYDETLVERFQREAVLAAGLDHPNIVPIYDVGEADGLVYIAMKLLGGPSLADVLRLRDALSPPELLPIVSQIASALDYAHARGIIHRDIKAANILLEQTEIGDRRAQIPPTNLQSPISNLRGMLTDFGIAKSLDAPGLTGTGVLIGTPDYMAPEQIRGGHTVDYRADIYALGVLVFRCLTGRRPFEGGTEEVLMGHLYGSIPDLASVAPSLPPAVGPVIGKAMARDPHDRYDSAGEFARALRAATGLEPPTPPPAMRRPLEGRAVVPRPAADALARPGPGTADQATRKGTVVPGGARLAQPQGAPPQPARPIQPVERRGGAGRAIGAALLLLLFGGGLLLAWSALVSGRTQDPVASGTTLPATPAPATLPPPVPSPTTQPAPSETPAEPPTQPPEPTAPPASVVPATIVPLPPTTTPTTVPPATTPTTAPQINTPTSTPTTTPTSAPPTTTPTSAPTNTPTARPCPDVPMAGGFGMLLEQHPRIRERLGCPTQAEQGGANTAAEQQFEQGSMFYFTMTEQVYVLIGRSRGEWLRFERDQLLPLPTPTPAASPICAQPMQGGFQLVWSNFGGVQRSLGCPTGPEDGLFEGAYQPFDRGTMLYSQKGLGRGKTLYVLYEDETFERYDDPNP